MPDTSSFTDAAQHKIYRWNETSKQAEVIAEIPGHPVVIGFVPTSTLLARRYEKAVYSLNVAALDTTQQITEVTNLASDTKFLLPVGVTMNFPRSMTCWPIVVRLPAGQQYCHLKHRAK